MNIYTVFEDEMVDYIDTQRALMSFTTETAAQSYLKGQIENIRSKWKNMDDFNLYDEMVVSANEPSEFGLYVPMHSDKWHDYLSIYKSTLVGV